MSYVKLLVLGWLRPCISNNIKTICMIHTVIMQLFLMRILFLLRGLSNKLVIICKVKLDGLKWKQWDLDLVGKNIWTLFKQNLLILMILFWDLLGQ